MASTILPLYRISVTQWWAFVYALVTGKVLGHPILMASGVLDRFPYGNCGYPFSGPIYGHGGAPWDESRIYEHLVFIFSFPTSSSTITFIDDDLIIYSPTIPSLRNYSRS